MVIHQVDKRQHQSYRKGQFHLLLSRKAHQITQLPYRVS